MPLNVHVIEFLKIHFSLSYLPTLSFTKRIFLSYTVSSSVLGPQKGMRKKIDTDFRAKYKLELKKPDSRTVRGTRVASCNRR